MPTDSEEDSIHSMSCYIVGLARIFLTPGKSGLPGPSIGRQRLSDMHHLGSWVAGWVSSAVVSTQQFEVEHSSAEQTRMNRPQHFQPHDRGFTFSYSAYRHAGREIDG